MSAELRLAIEVAIEEVDDGDGARLGPVVEAVARGYGISRSLEKVRSLYDNGEIYAVGDCRLKLRQKRGSALVADGGWEGQTHVVDTPDEDPRTMPPDPETAHADYLLGRRFRVDWGERTDVGEIVAVRDHRDHARELKIRIETETAFRDRVFRPARTDCELVEANDE